MDYIIKLYSLSFLFCGRTTSRYHVPSQGATGPLAAFSNTQVPKPVSKAQSSVIKVHQAYPRCSERSLRCKVNITCAVEVVWFIIAFSYRHFIKEDLPRIQYANPDLTISVDKLPRSAGDTWRAQMLLEFSACLFGGQLAFIT